MCVVWPENMCCLSCAMVTPCQYLLPAPLHFLLFLPTVRAYSRDHTTHHAVSQSEARIMSEGPIRGQDQSSYCEGTKTGDNIPLHVHIHNSDNSRNQELGKWSLAVVTRLTRALLWVTSLKLSCRYLCVCCGVQCGYIIFHGLYYNTRLEAPSRVPLPSINLI